MRIALIGGDVSLIMTLANSTNGSKAVEADAACLHPKVSSSTINFDIHLLDPGVDRYGRDGRMSPGVVLAFNRHQVIGIEILKSVQAIKKNVQAVAVLG
jgi:hypothetical protein